MDFSLSPALRDLQQRTRDFIAKEVIPLENDPRQTAHGPEESLRAELVDKAGRAGLLTPHASKEMGGLGLSHVEKAVVFEEAGYSPLGPVALNIHAPDEANIHLMEAIATAGHKERWLRPLVQGHIRSCFAMTEPSPGAGADPSMLQTTATRDGDHYLINGGKWFITGAEGASFVIIMAKLENGGNENAATMFLADMNQPGIKLERMMDSLDNCFSGGHGVLRFENLRVPASDVLGELGKGFRYAQVRLAPARLTHCMRWLGQARRAHDVALGYAQKRQAFGKALGEHEGVGFMLADSEMDIHSSRLNILHTAWVLDQGGKGNIESSMTKVMVSEAVWRIVDRSVQILGGQGVTAETIVMRIFKDIRAFRIYDGPSEVHRWSIANKLMKKSASMNDMFSLKGQRALVTGASSGLGRHFALTLAKAGADVAVAARRKDKLAEVVEQIVASGGRAIAVTMNVTDRNSVCAALDEIKQSIGVAGIVVNNAGVTDTKRPLDYTDEDWQAIVGTNLGGAWIVAQETSRHMIAANIPGSIINITSILADRVAGGVSPYSASKAGLKHLTQAFALELARHNIRVNSIAPGYIATDLNRDFLASDAGEKLKARIPARRFGEPGNLDGALLLLASYAGAYMSGSEIVVDGGHLCSSL